jgi:hypothetical protein
MRCKRKMGFIDYLNQMTTHLYRTSVSLSQKPLTSWFVIMVACSMTLLGCTKGAATESAASIPTRQSAVRIYQDDEFVSTQTRPCASPVLLRDYASIGAKRISIAIVKHIGGIVDDPEHGDPAIVMVDKDGHGFAEWYFDYPDHKIPSWRDSAPRILYRVEGTKLTAEWCGDKPSFSSPVLKLRATIIYEE